MITSGPMDNVRSVGHVQYSHTDETTIEFSLSIHCRSLEMCKKMGLRACRRLTKSQPKKQKEKKQTNTENTTTFCSLH